MGPNSPPPRAAGPPTQGHPRFTRTEQGRGGRRQGWAAVGRTGKVLGSEHSVQWDSAQRAGLSSALEPPLGWSGLVWGPSGEGRRPFQRMPTPGRDTQCQPQPVSLRARLVPPPAPAPGRMAQAPRSGKSSRGYPGKEVAKDMRLRRSLGLPLGDPAPRQAQGGLNTELTPALSQLGWPPAESFLLPGTQLPKSLSVET